MTAQENESASGKQVSTTTASSVRSPSPSLVSETWDDADSVETAATANEETPSTAPHQRKRALTVTQDAKDAKNAKDTFADVPLSPERTPEEDWEFWSKVVSDFSHVAKPELSLQIQRGVPQALRGMVWQLLAKAKDAKLEESYMQLLKLESVYEKAIVRDLSRTFPTHEYFQTTEGQEALYNVVKAYSLYDPDVGYCQGIAFIAGPLLLNMPEEEAFCVLVQMMQKYGLRGHYMSQLDLLPQRLYQLDGLLHDHLPHIHRHFQLQGIRANMYASQWFLTLFAYKFPIQLVFRIYDILLSEGIEVLFSFSIALFRRNQPTILSLEFEPLVNYLKNDMLLVYQENMNELIQDAYTIKIPAKRLARLAKDYKIEAARAHSEAEQIETLRKQNKALAETIRQLEQNLTEANREHALAANELIESRLDIARINDENDALRQQSEDLKRALEMMPAEIEARVKEEMEILCTKNAALVQRNSALEDQMAYMENMVAQMKVTYEESEREREALRQRLADLKRLVE